MSFIYKAREKFCLWCAKKNVIAEFIRFHPLLNNHRYFDGDVIDDRPTIWIDLDVDDLMSHYTVRVRTAVRKAEKNGLTIKWVKGSEYISIFYEMYSAAMREIGAAAFYIFPMAYHAELLTWDHSHLAVCTQDGTVIAAAVFIIESVFVGYHLSFSTLQGKKMGATNLLLHTAALRTKEMGCKVLHLGGGSDDRIDNPLLFFKSGFSNLSALFKIGKKIHNPLIYYKMKLEWESKHSSTSNKFLFYRFEPIKEFL
jgi:lipid II:glycine glycyltransferase (peptidoglycan interpeptide bridge formation enzyme)